MVKEHLLWTLSHKVYRLDSKHKDHITLKAGEVKRSGEFKYKILKVEDNTVNGMQAMAVAPIKNDKVDTSDIIIAFAGTNIKTLTI